MMTVEISSRGIKVRLVDKGSSRRPGEVMVLVGIEVPRVVESCIPRLGRGVTDSALLVRRATACPW